VSVGREATAPETRVARLLTTSELAQALGVSESSIKRWVDDGTIRGARTAGGHRRIAITEALRFIRATRAPLADPELLGVPEVAAAGSDRHTAGGPDERLLAYLERGEAVRATGLLLALFLGGERIADLADGPLRAAMARLGELWRERPDGIFVEHRATAICIEAVSRLRTLLPNNDGAPAAVGGAPAGDPYALPTLCAAAVLAEVGFRSTNLGPDTPFDTLEHAAVATGAQLVWVAVTVRPRDRHFERDLVDLGSRLGKAGATLAVGGRGIEGRRRPAHPPYRRQTTMASLAELGNALMRRHLTRTGGVPTLLRDLNGNTFSD